MNRNFIPGSEWLYIKLYTGFFYSDQILVNIIGPLVKHLIDNNIIEKWFFIRYTDPDPHLRVRFLLTDKNYMGLVIQGLYNQINLLVSKKIIWKVQLDTYNRELERYSNLMEESETIFYIDSMCILSILSFLDKNKSEEYRWMAALKLIDSFFNDFSFDLLTKYKLMKWVSEKYKEEFGFNKYNSKQFNHKFRVNKETIELVLNSKEIVNSDFSMVLNLIAHRSDHLKDVIRSIREKKEIPFLKEGDLNNAIVSYIHMTLIRLFKNRNRIYELIIYDFMRRYYMSQLAKKGIKY